nr:MAG TPA: hypothetical protein [Caudoviricetes sp.]
MKHTKLVGLQSPVEQMANVAANAAQAARETTTRTSGVISVDNSDGTKTILGSGNGVAINVGDTTPPSKPVGLAAASQNGSIVAYWSGSLEEEKPADFYCVTLYAEKDGTPVKMGELTAAGSCIISGLTVGEVYRVYATAEDNTCNYDGSPAHNVSEKSDPVMVEVLGGGNGGSADIDRLKALAEQAAKEAKAAKATADNTQKVVEELNNSFSHDSEGAHVGAKTGMHTTIDAQGMKLKKGNEEVASFQENGVKLASGSLRIHAGFIKDIADNSTALSSDCFDFEAETLEYHYAPRFFFRAKSHNQANNGFVGTDYDLGMKKLGIASPNGAVSINTDDLVKLMKFVPWTDLVNNQWVRVRYCVRSGFMYLDCWMAGGYPTYTTPTQIPDNLLPAKAAYYPLATQQGNNTAKMWLGAEGGGDGHVYLYNYDSGYCSGVVPVIPKSME